MTAQEFHNALPLGGEISGYRIDSVLGAHAFAITYRATEIGQDRAVALKEYLPTSLAMRQADGRAVGPLSSAHRQTFDWGLRSFQEEAQILYDLSHTNIVPVLGCFRENGTAYLVMKFQEGERLSARLQAGPLSEAEIDHVFPPIMDALDGVHGAGLQHLDLRPDKILTRPDGTPVLLDFGRANQLLAQRTDNAGSVAADGYAPHEQYEKTDNLGPWTDIYALGAVLYHCMTGQKPVAAPERAFAAFRGEADPLQSQAHPPAGSYRGALFTAVQQAMQIPEKARPQSIGAFRDLFGTPGDAAPEAAAAPAVSAVEAADAGDGDFAAEADARTVRAKPPETGLVPVEAPPPPVVAEPSPVPAPALPKRASWRRRPAVIAGGGLAALLLVGGVGAATLWSDGATAPPAPGKTEASPAGPARDAERILKAAERREKEEAARREREARRTKRSAPKKSTEPRLAALFANRRLLVRLPGRLQPTLLRFAAGGGLSGHTERSGLQTGYINERGAWWVRGKQMCLRLTEWNRGAAACFAIAYTGDPKAARVGIAATGAVGRFSGALTY